MGHRVTFTWADFRDLFARMPSLQKLAVINVRCSNPSVIANLLMPGSGKSDAH
jgi:hypothetical protein